MHVETGKAQPVQSVLAPVLAADEPGYAALQALVQRLRGEGVRVIYALAADEAAPCDARALGCTHCVEPDMTHSEEFWQVREI